MIPFRPGSRVGYVVLANGCWQWRGAVAPNGYGKVGIPNTRRVGQAHRVYWERLHGPVPVGLELDHLCRHRDCVNPKHLEPVTRRENAWRGAKSKLDWGRVTEIRRRYRKGGITHRELAAEFGVTYGHIGAILHNTRWSLP